MSGTKKTISKINPYYFLIMYFVVGGLFTGGMATIVQGRAFGFENVTILAVTPAFFVGAISAIVISYLVIRNRNILLGRITTEKDVSSDLKKEIAERKQAERVLQDSEERYRRLVELSPDAVLVHSGTHVLFANDAAAKLYGADSPQRLVGMERNDLIHADEHKLANKRYQRFIKKGLSSGPIKRRCLRLDSGVVMVETAAAPIVWEGKPAAMAVLRDITDRLRTETALHASEQLFRDFAESASDRFWETDAEHRFIRRYWNDRSEHAIPENDFIGKTYWDIHGEAGKNLSVDGLKRLMMVQEPFRHCDIELFPVDERRRFRRISGKPYFDENGSFAGFRGVATNITEEIYYRDLSAQLGARLESVTENSPAAIFLKDLEERFQFVNRRFAEWYGVSQPEAVGKTSHDLFPKNMADSDVAQEHEVIRTRKVIEREHEIVFADGSRHLIIVTKFPVFDDKEDLVGVGTVNIDITARKHAESALRESEARYRNLIEGSNLGIQIGTREKGRVYANRACAELFGYDSPEEFIAVPMGGHIVEHDYERLAKFRQAVFDGEDIPLTYEFEGVRKDGSIIPLQAYARRIVWEGEDAIQRTFIDLTERKHAEEQLRQAQKMEAVGQLTGGVAHDFNNLLTVVIGSLELIDRKLEDPFLTKMAQNALAASKRGADLTQRLLAFSRKQSLSPKSVDLNQTVSGMIHLMRTTVGETVDMDVRTSGDIWHCRADPGQLENAILNLAINGRDAMPAGGRLTIETANISLGEGYAASHPGFTAGDYVAVSVSDTGTGISLDLLDRVFDPFFTTKDIGKGSGLGLSMVYGFIKQSGGDVEIESEEGRGTTVTLYLPRSFETGEPAAPAPDEDVPAARGEKILLVEDQADVRAITVNILNDLGYDVTEASHGREALELLQHTQGFDLVLSDILLPGGMSGLDIAADAGRLRPNLPFLFISGYADDILTERNLADDDIRLLRKPFTKISLAQNLRAVLDG